MANTLTARRRELIDRLLVVQNCDGNENIDIMTITGFMNEAEVEKHLAYYEAKELKRMLALKPRRAVA